MKSYLFPNGERKPPHVSSDYGPRRAPTPGASSFHRGVDFTGFSDILACGDGIVIGAGVLPGWAGGGQQVAIDHGDSIVTRYMHMRTGSITVRAGQSVKRGQKLGTMGATGTATGVHLHFEVRLSGASVDPIPWILRYLPKTPVSVVVGAVTPKPSEANMALPITFSTLADPKTKKPTKTVVVQGQSGKYVHVKNPYHLRLLQRVAKGDPNILASELVLVRDLYLSRIA